MGDKQPPLTLTVQVEMEIPYQRVSDMLVSAFEGGSNYWIDRVDLTKPSEIRWLDDHHSPAGPWYHIYPLNPGGAVIVHVSEDEPRVLDMDAIKKGLQLMASDKTLAHHWRDFISENDDACTADVFLQFCLFGEVIYG